MCKHEKLKLEKVQTFKYHIYMKRKIFKRMLMSVYFCGGSCMEDVTTHLIYHLSLHPTLRTCSADTILRAIKELTQDNISYIIGTASPHICL